MRPASNTGLTAKDEVFRFHVWCNFLLALNLKIKSLPFTCLILSLTCFAHESLSSLQSAFPLCEMKHMGQIQTVVQNRHHRKHRKYIYS